MYMMMMIMMMMMIHTWSSPPPHEEHLAEIHPPQVSPSLIKSDGMKIDF